MRPIIVVGSVVMDHKWYPVGRLSNSSEDYPLWRVERRHGGVGRNVAENLARLGALVYFAGLSGTGEPEIEARLNSAGVRLALVRVPHPVGRFDVHLDTAGRLTRSRVRLPPDELLTWDALRVALPELGDAALVAVETGLAEPTLRAVRDYTRRRDIALLGMPTRLADHGPRRHLVREMDILVLNEIEAAMLTGLSGGAREQLAALRGAGPSTVVLTLGSHGVVAASAQNPEPRYFPAPEVSCVDDTGAGDALTAAVAAALVEPADLTAAVTRGLTAAGVTVGCPDSTCRRIGLTAAQSVPRPGRPPGRRSSTAPPAADNPAGLAPG